MAGVTRKGDYCTGHDSCSATALVEGSPNVFINGAAVGRVGDKYAAHGCIVHSSHQDSISSGSSSVFVNGKPIARVGDSVSIAGNVRNGSENVFAN